MSPIRKEVIGPCTLNVLNLGAGVQSSTLLLMSCRGVLPKYDAAIFADTQWEPNAVYVTLGFLATEAGNAGIPLLQISAGNLRADALVFQESYGDVDGRYASMPLYVRNPDGSDGIIRRQCTSEYKIRPIVKAVREKLLGVDYRKWVPGGVLVRSHRGISADEHQRARVSTDEPWIQPVYPLLGMGDETLPGPMTRADCLAWLDKFYPGQAFPRSACIGCPFHSDDEWLDMKTNRPDEWADAVDFDYRMREAEGRRRQLDGQVFLHDSRVPLDKAVLKPSKAKAGVSLWRQECLGMCGI